MMMWVVRAHFTYGLPRKVDLHQGVHEILPVAVEAQDLPHPVHEGVVHCGGEGEREGEREGGREGH